MKSMQFLHFISRETYILQTGNYKIDINMWIPFLNLSLISFDFMLHTSRCRPVGAAFSFNIHFKSVLRIRNGFRIVPEPCKLSTNEIEEYFCAGNFESSKFWTAFWKNILRECFDGSKFILVPNTLLLRCVNIKNLNQKE